MLDKLTAAHADAAEIRIRSLEQQILQRSPEGRDPVIGATMPDRMMQFFAHAHLPPHLAAASRPFCELAEHIVATLPSNPERTVALRKLLEAKDCAVRALLYK